MTASTALKVPKDKLIERIEEARDSAAAEFQSARDSEVAEIESWERQANRSFQKVVDKFNAGKLNLRDACWSDYRRRSDGYVAVIEVYGVQVPSKPSTKKFNPDRYNADIRLLKMADTDLITVSTNNRWGEYL